MLNLCLNLVTAVLRLSNAPGRSIHSTDSTQILRALLHLTRPLHNRIHGLCLAAPPAARPMDVRRACMVGRGAHNACRESGLDQWARNGWEAAAILTLPSSDSTINDNSCPAAAFCFASWTARLGGTQDFARAYSARDGSKVVSVFPVDAEWRSSASGHASRDFVSIRIVLSATAGSLPRTEWRNSDGSTAPTCA